LRAPAVTGCQIDAPENFSSLVSLSKPPTPPAPSPPAARLPPRCDGLGSQRFVGLAEMYPLTHNGRADVVLDRLPQRAKTLEAVAAVQPIEDRGGPLFGSMFVRHLGPRPHDEPGLLGRWR